MAFDVAVRIGCICVDNGGVDVWTYPRDVHGNDGWLYNDDIVQVLTYIVNPTGYGFREVEIWFEFKNQQTGEIIEWGRGTYDLYYPSDTDTVTSWLSDFCASSTTTAADLLGADRVVEARVCFGDPINMCSNPAVLTVGDPCACECTEWQDRGCASEIERRYTRVCTPSGCDIEETFESDPSCETPPPPPSNYKWLIGLVAAGAGLGAAYYLWSKK